MSNETDLLTKAIRQALADTTRKEDDFDWVTERGKCDLRSTFCEFRDLIQKDIERIQSLIPAAAVKFTNRLGDGSNTFMIEYMTVMRGGQILVILDENKKSIIVQGAESHDFNMKVEWDSKNARRIIRIDGEDEPVRLWEVSKRTLETILTKSNF